MSGVPDIGQPVFLVIVRCSCPDRWWAQPEGGPFPLCQACGEEARWIGYQPLAWDEHRAGRVRNSLGIAGHVLGEFAALRAVEALANTRATWEEKVMEAAQ